MDISFVLAVYNGLHLTKDCYNHLRRVYPDAPLVISSGGSNDGTKEWLESLVDDNLSYFHDDERLTFSDNYNTAIKIVDTEKLVLIHNDMVIGEGFLENLERLLTPDTLLSYTTVEPPIFEGHTRPGKVIRDFGSGFLNFNQNAFDEYVLMNKDNCNMVDGAVFFMSGYKSLFEDVGFFDGFSFTPVFCEDDDFIIRTKLKGYKLKTTSCAIVYHFVSQTIRFGEDYRKDRTLIEIANNRNFVRKWGITSQTFNEQRYWEDEIFRYTPIRMGLTTRNKSRLFDIEPFFDKIDLGEIPTEYIQNEQPRTNYDLRSKFTLTNDVDVMLYEVAPLTDSDIYTIHKLRLSIPHYEPGIYEAGSLRIEIKKGS